MHHIRHESLYDLLQKVGIELLTVKCRADLIKLVKTVLLPEIGATQAAIYILDSGTNQLDNLLHRDDPAQEQAVFNPQLSLKELAIEEVLMDSNADLSGFCELGTEEDWPPSSIRKYLWKVPAPGSRILAFSLRENNDFIGTLFLLFTDASGLSPAFKGWLKLVAMAINLAVIRLLMEERASMLEKNAHLLKLFKLSSRLTTVREFTELEQVVQELLLPYLNAVSCIVILKSIDESSRCVLLAKEPGSGVTSLTGEVYAGPFSVYEACYGTTPDVGKLTHYRLESLNTLAQKTSHLQVERSSGIGQKAVYPLGAEDRILGFLIFNYTTKQALTGLETPVVTLLLAQLNSLIIRLADQEQVRKRMAQQELVISLGTLIASARDTNELLELITEKLKAEVGFTHMNLSLLTTDKSTASAYLLDDHAVSQQHADYSRVAFRSYPMHDGYMDKVAASAEPLLFRLEHPLSPPGLPDYLKINYESGIRQVVMTRLSKGSDVVGFWLLAFEHDRTLPACTLQLLKQVASQLSESVQNRMISLKYERREKEKNRFIQFSNAIASIQDRNKLAQTIREHLMELVGIEDFQIWSLTPDFHYRSPILFDESSRLVNHPCFQTDTQGRFKNADGIYDVLLEEKRIKYFSTEALKSAYPDHPYFAKNNAEKQLMAMGGSILRVGNEVIGILTFFTRHMHLVREKEELFLSICSQLAITASNRITTDRIAAQLTEIKSYNERLEDEKIHLLKELEVPTSKSDMIGTSMGIQTVLKLIQQVAYTESTVLILGETGTGKELVARSVHDNSPRKSKLMVKVNCAALPANLVESELFGHEKGSFTGALEKRIGKFELANQGTLFLDEIGEMPLDLQGKLLRALQEKEIERIGGKASIKVDVRVIVATNRNLEKEVAQGRFRSDLFYRINIFPIRLPPLRDRIPDIPLLTSHFITKYAAKAKKEIKSLSSNVLRDLQRYHWPGNIRELEHLIERSVLLTRGDTLKIVDIPKTTPSLDERSLYTDKKSMTLFENERAHILRVIKLCNGRIHGQGGAATLLGIPPSTLNSKMKKLNIGKQEIRS